MSTRSSTATASTWTATASRCAARWRCIRTSSCSPATRTWSFDFDVDASLLEVGGGGHWPLTDKIDLIGKLGIVKAEIDVGPFDADDDGFLLGARVRGVVAPKFELEGGFDYRDLDEAGDDTTIVFEGRYFFIEQLAGGLSVSIGDDVTSLGLNVRMTF